MGLGEGGAAARPDLSHRQTFHNIVLRILDAVFTGAILLDNLEYLRPQPVCLCHVGVRNRHIGRLDCCNSSRMFCEKSEFTGDRLARQRYYLIFDNYLTSFRICDIIVAKEINISHIKRGHYEKTTLFVCLAMLLL